jgi:hypothetical protein
MTTVIPSRTAERNDGREVRQTSCETCPTAPEDQFRKQEADCLFEARLQWFLAVSRAA